MATQSSNLYSTNTRHMIDDLTPEKNGIPYVNMEDDVIRGSTVLHKGEITFPPPKPKIVAIAKHTNQKEELLDFKREISIMYFKSTDNTDGFFPLSENFHENGILKKTIAPAIRQGQIELRGLYLVMVKELEMLTLLHLV